ncbi:hypothetical protein [Scytonema sp. PRP1]|uniref:hypothetical protein n=1 Tax=Scytonema sp. PRP1 TaxID=3120513 RepID=UPI002FD2BA4A
MNSDKISSNKVEELISQLAQQKLRQTDITPLVVFLTNLVVMLFSVMKVNSSVEDVKIEQIRNTLSQFDNSDNYAYQLLHLVFENLQKNPVIANDFTKPGRVATLTDLHSQSEKLLLIGLCYKILANNGIMNERGKAKLWQLADWITIKPQHIEVLKAGLGLEETTVSEQTGLGKEKFSVETLAEVESLLKDPFESLGSLFVEAASEMMAVISTKLKPLKVSHPPQQPQLLKEISPNAKPSDIFKWEPSKSKDNPKLLNRFSYEDATGEAYIPT